MGINFHFSDSLLRAAFFNFQKVWHIDYISIDIDRLQWYNHCAIELTVSFDSQRDMLNYGYSSLEKAD